LHTFQERADEQLKEVKFARVFREHTVFPIYYLPFCTLLAMDRIGLACTAWSAFAQFIDTVMVPVVWEVGRKPPDPGAREAR